MKSSFLIYLSYEEQFNLLSDEELGQLMRAIMQYEKTGEVPKLEGMLKMAFSFIKSQLDKDNEKYNEVCERNKRNGALGGRPKKDDKENPVGFKETERFFKNPTKPRETQKTRYR